MRHSLQINALYTLIVDGSKVGEHNKTFCAKFNNERDTARRFRYCKHTETNMHSFESPFWYMSRTLPVSL
jgi:hypothetical protein